MIKEKKSVNIRRKMEENGKVKKMMCWRDEAGPSELRDKSGKIESDLEKVASIFHNAVEEKVLGIVREMEK